MRLLFRVPGACAPAFALGLVGGYPVGAKTAIALYEQKLCTKTEAERLSLLLQQLRACFYFGHRRRIGVCQHPRAGILLYVCHILASSTWWAWCSAFTAGGSQAAKGGAGWLSAANLSAPPWRKASAHLPHPS